VNRGKEGRQAIIQLKRIGRLIKIIGVKQKRGKGICIRKQSKLREAEF
jgi:hypothetical protein